jgi:hypothetical protein
LEKASTENYYFQFCKTVADISEKITITSLLKDGKSVGWYVKPGTPVPNEKSSELKALQTFIITHVIKQNESYLGSLQYVHVRQKAADVFLFPESHERILCVVILPPFDEEKLVAAVTESIETSLLD